MKKMLLILVIGVLVSCNPKVDSDGTTKSGELDFTIVTVDNCQYLMGFYGDTRLFTHKGDCTNPIHAPIVMYSDTTLANELMNDKDSIK